MAYVVVGSGGSENTAVIVSAEWDATIPLSADEARQLAIRLIEVATKIDPPIVSDEWD